MAKASPRLSPPPSVVLRRSRKRTTTMMMMTTTTSSCVLEFLSLRMFLCMQGLVTFQRDVCVQMLTPLTLVATPSLRRIRRWRRLA